MSCHRALLAVMLAAAVAPLAARQEPTRIRTRTELTTVQFLAVAADGRPIVDLKPQEVTLRIDGRERPLKLLEFVRLASASIGGDPAPKLLPAPYATNRPLDAGRLVTIILAHESIRAGREQSIKEAASRFIAGLSPRDRVSIVTLPRGRVEVDFTSDRAKLTGYLSRFVGQAPDNPSEADRLCRTRLTLNGTSDLLRGLAAIEGPKTVIVIASGLMPPKRDGTLTSAKQGWAPGACELVTRDFDEVGETAASAGAHVYVIQPADIRMDTGRPSSDGMTRPTGGIRGDARAAFADPTASRFAAEDDELMGLQNLASITGGELFRLTAAPAADVFARIARESSGYYVAAFEPDAGERNAQTHSLAIRISRDHVRVRTRPQIVIARPASPGTAPAPQTLLRAPDVHRDLLMRVTAYTARETGSDVRILAAAEPLDPGVKVAAAAFGVFGEGGRLLKQSTLGRGDIRDGALIEAALPVRPGEYRLRVALVDAEGRTGTADVYVDARLADAGPLKTSGIALGVTRDGVFVPRMEFGGEPIAVAYLEVYGRAPKPDSVGVAIEIGETLDGPPLGTLPARVVQSDTDPDRRVVMAAIPISGLLRGDFVVRAVVSIDGARAGTVQRTLRKIQS
jgi:VWFA-related protein